MIMDVYTILNAQRAMELTLSQFLLQIVPGLFRSS